MQEEESGDKPMLNRTPISRLLRSAWFERGMALNRLVSYAYLSAQLLLPRLDSLSQTLRSPWLPRVLPSTRVIATAALRHVLAEGLQAAIDISANREQFALTAIG